MKTRHRFYLLLSYKFNLNIFNGFEKRFAQKLLRESPHPQSESQSIRYKFLIFHKAQSQTSLLTKMKVLLHFLKNRGQFRTLLMISDPFSGSESFYQISRLKLILHLLRNLGVLKSNLLDKLSFEFLSHESHALYDEYQITQLGNLYEIRKFYFKKSFLMEKPYAEPYRIRIDGIIGNHKSLVDQFINWNSFIFINFIRNHEIEDHFVPKLSISYLFIFEDLKKFRRVKFEDHERSGFDLDSLRESVSNAAVVLENAEIWHQKFIYSENRILNLDATASPALDYVAGIWPFVRRLKTKESLYEIIAPGVSVLKLKEAIYLIGRVDENWYHFLLDTAPRLLFFDSVPSSVPILIRRDLPETSKEFLRRITSRQVLEVDVSDLIRVEFLYVLPGRSTVFDSRPPKGQLQVKFSPLCLKIFREKVLESMATESLPIRLNRISFDRNSVTRNVINSKSIHQVLVDFSFENIPLDLKFFRRQVSIFSHSSVVVSPGGAVLANIVFMNPGSKVVALTNFRGRRIDLWRKLSAACDLSYVEVNGIPSYWGFRYLRILHSNFYISPRKLRRILSREI